MPKQKFKRGFTLIELLAIILILCIITFIAIPIVNNIVTESKKDAFEVSANNVVTAIEDACSMQNLKGQAITTAYAITDGVISPSVGIKGDIPQNGQITVNSDCQVAAELSNSIFAAEKVFA